MAATQSYGLWLRHERFFVKRANPQSTEEFGRLIQSLSNSELYEIRGSDSTKSRSARATLSIVRATTHQAFAQIPGRQQLVISSDLRTRERGYQALCLRAP